MRIRRRGARERRRGDPSARREVFDANGKVRAGLKKKGKPAPFVCRERVSTPPVLDHFLHAPSAGVQSARSRREKYLSRRACAVDRRAGYRAPRASRRVYAMDRARCSSTIRSRTSCSRRLPRWRRPGHPPTRHRTSCAGTRVSISHIRSLSRMPFRAPRRPREARRGGSRRRANPALTRRWLSPDSPCVLSAWRVCDTFGTSRGEGGSVAGRRRFDHHLSLLPAKKASEARLIRDFPSSPSPRERGGTRHTTPPSRVRRAGSIVGACIGGTNGKARPRDVELDVAARTTGGCGTS